MEAQDTRTWNIVFKGEVLPGLNIDTVQKDCVQLLKLSPEKVSRMFSGRKITLRKSLDQARLEKYTTFFQRCGLRVHVVEEKNVLRILDETPPEQTRSANGGLLHNPLKDQPRQQSLLLKQRQSEDKDTSEEIFAEQTIIAPYLGQSNFYDALIRKNDGSTTNPVDAIFSSRSAGNGPGRTSIPSVSNRGMQQYSHRGTNKLIPILIIASLAIVITIIYFVFL